MEALVKVCEAVLGQFVCFDNDVYRGQCTRLPKYLLSKCGVEIGPQTGNGYKVVDTIVAKGGYCMDEATSVQKGYRVCSCDVSGSTYGHTWVEVLVDGNWVIYEQNVKREGTVSADFGVGTVYSVSKAYARGSWRNNTRYAGHPSIDSFIEANTPKPEPTPEPEPLPTPPVVDDFVVGEKVSLKKYVDYYGTLLIKTRSYYYISEINGDRAVLNADAVDGPVYCAANTNNLIGAEGDDDDSISVGDKVLPIDFVDYSGTPLKQTRDYYYVMQINGDRAVLTADSVDGTIYAAININNLRKV